MLINRSVRAAAGLVPVPEHILSQWKILLPILLRGTGGWARGGGYSRQKFKAELLEALF